MGTSYGMFCGIGLLYSRKISRAKIFVVDLPQNSSRIKFQGSTRLSLHLYAIIRFLRINFRGSSEIRENSKMYCPQKISTIRYLESHPHYSADYQLINNEAISASHEAMHMVMIS